MRQSLANVLLIAALLGCVVLGLMRHAHSHYSDEWKDLSPEMRSWFQGLHSPGMGGQPCCDGADGHHVADIDWDTQCDTIAGQETCHYRVRLNKEWVDVPDNAVIHQPNRYGQAVVWPGQNAAAPDGYYRDAKGHIVIRCFIAGAGI